MRRALFCFLATIALSTPAKAGDPAERIEKRIQTIESLLQQWQFVDAREMAGDLLMAHPDLPAVQLVAGWVKFHFAEHQTARELVERAVAAFGGKVESDYRVELIRSAASISDQFERHESAGGRVVVFCRPGIEEILVPYLFETVEKTIEVVGGDLGYRPRQPVLVEILPDAEALADSTGLTPGEIETSGTIAVCKYGRLLLTSPRATLKGYGWLDTVSHEMTHMIISQKTHNRTPIWLHEALARYEDSRWRADEPLYRGGLMPHTQSRLARALKTGALITFEQMHPSMALLPSQQATELAFSEVYMAAGYMLELKGYAGIRKLLENLRDGQSDMEAIQRVFGLKREEFVAGWTRWMRAQNLVQLEGELDMSGWQEQGRSSDSRGEKALTGSGEVDLRDHFHLGQLLRARKRIRASVVEYTKAVSRAGPRHIALWLLSDKLGLALMQLDREKEAREAFESSLSINPNDLEAHLHKALLLREKEPYRAWLHLRECLRRNPMDPRVHAIYRRVVGELERRGDRRQDFPMLVAREERALKLLAGHRRDSKGSAVAGTGRQRDGQPGYLRIHTRPWARVWLDFKDTGLSTPVFSLPVEEGEHFVGLVASCSEQPIVVKVFVKRGVTETIDRDICPPADHAGKGASVSE